MRIKVARTAGFCFGVRRAVETVKKLIAEREPQRRIYTLGKLIHNPHVVAKLESSGVAVLSEDNLFEIAETATEQSPVTIVIRAHGTPLSVTDRLQKLSAGNPALTVLDCTCPFVKKIHSIVEKEATPDRTLIVSGDPNHPEVKGIISYSRAPWVVIPSVESVDLCNFTNKDCVLVAQTTQKLAEWNKCKLFFENYCTNAKFFDTICIATENRQSEAEQLAQEVDLMVVIGGRDSSTTRALYTVARRHLANTVLIEDASELDPELIRAAHNIGITAGASTPSDIIEEVYTTMSEIIESMENFETLLEGSLKTLNTGDIVKGVITSISSTEVHVDLSANVTGIIPAEEHQNRNDQRGYGGDDGQNFFYIDLSGHYHHMRPLLIGIVLKPMHVPGGAERRIHGKTGQIPLRQRCRHPVAGKGDLKKRQSPGGRRLPEGWLQENRPGKTDRDPGWGSAWRNAAGGADAEQAGRLRHRHGR